MTYKLGNLSYWPLLNISDGKRVTLCALFSFLRPTDSTSQLPVSDLFIIHIYSFMLIFAHCAANHQVT